MFNIYLRYIPINESNIEFSFGPSCLLNWAELSLELGRVVLVRDFIGPSGLVRVVSGPSCPAPVGFYPVSKRKYKFLARVKMLR